MTAEESPASAKVASASATNAIVLKGVTRRFGATVAVQDVSFVVPEGCVFGLIGPNGAGKTTTFSMLAGYLAPTKGEIRMLDRAPTAVEDLKGRVGVLPQDALLPAGERVGDFLVYLARLQGFPAAKARAAAEKVLAEVEGRDWWSTNCNALSHGMAKRVGLAQALLGDPDVVLLDEPTAGLDPRVAYEVRQLVKARRGRCTMVVSSHNLQELEEVCDMAAILDRGQLITVGTIAELTSSSSEVRFDLARGPVPADPVRAIEGVKAVVWSAEERALFVTFDRAVCDAEEIIRRGTYVLYQHDARISAISKGRGLEQRVMELTE
jgi:ABC-type multidrug transport system ATPase subunit